MYDYLLGRSDVKDGLCGPDGSNASVVVVTGPRRSENDIRGELLKRRILCRFNEDDGKAFRVSVLRHGKEYPLASSAGLWDKIFNSAEHFDKYIEKLAIHFVVNCHIDRFEASDIARPVILPQRHNLQMNADEAIAAWYVLVFPSI